MSAYRVLHNQLDAARENLRYSKSRLRDSQFNCDSWGIGYWTGQIDLNKAVVASFQLQLNKFLCA